MGVFIAPPSLGPEAGLLTYWVRGHDAESGKEAVLFDWHSGRVAARVPSTLPLSRVEWNSHGWGAFCEHVGPGSNVISLIQPPQYTKREAAAVGFTVYDLQWLTPDLLVFVGITPEPAIGQTDPSLALRAWGDQADETASECASNGVTIKGDVYSLHVGTGRMERLTRLGDAVQVVATNSGRVLCLRSCDDARAAVSSVASAGNTVTDVLEERDLWISHRHNGERITDLNRAQRLLVVRSRGGFLPPSLSVLDIASSSTIWSCRAHRALWDATLGPLDEVLLTIRLGRDRFAVQEYCASGPAHGIVATGESAPSVLGLTDSGWIIARSATDIAAVQRGTIVEIDTPQQIS